MSVLRRIFSHGWFIVLIILLVVGFYYRHQLFPSLFGQTGTGEEPRTMESTPPPSKHAGTADAPAESDRGSERPSERAVGGATDARISAPAPRQSDPEPPPSRTAPSGAPSMDQDPAVPAAGMGAAPATQAPESGPETGSPAQPPQGGGAEGLAGQQMTTAQALEAARGAFWAGDYPTAIAIYTRLLEQQPDQVDWHGELGNIYYAQGQWKSAGEAYYQAARRLAKSGDIARALELRRIIRGLHPEKADALAEDLRAAHRRYR